MREEGRLRIFISCQKTPSAFFASLSSFPFSCAFGFLFFFLHPPSSSFSSSFCSPSVPLLSLLLAIHTYRFISLCF
ncbi:MAG: hypothetical protein JOS17DRAFT_432176 [Linnemannia elongata]|nr:MAG: hypothetical protein JOS17DRAFT_432176 [Linnemannia elongata]